MKKICDLMEKVLYIVGMASVAVFFVCTTVQVCSRVFGFQAAFTEEVANALWHGAALSDQHQWYALMSILNLQH